MGFLNLEEEYLYKKNTDLSAEFLKNTVPERKFLNEYMWQEASRHDIWRLPIAKEYGGKGLSWQDCIIAIRGFSNHNLNEEFLTSLINHIHSLYFIYQNGSAILKENYLQRLMQGEPCSLIISDHIYELFPGIFRLDEREQRASKMMRNNLCVHLERIIDEVWFYMSEKKLYATVGIPNEPLRSILIDESKYMTHEEAVKMLEDLIHFEKLVYEILYP